MKKKVFLEISKNSQENTCARVSTLIRLQASGLCDTLAQAFSCEIYEISKNTFFTDNLWTTASVSSFGNLFFNLGLAIYGIRITH